MAPLPDYVAGTITLTNGSTAFTGSGTGWLAAGFREGDTILGIEDNPGVVYVVESVTDNDSGTLTQPWDGPTGTYTYRMRYLSDGQRVTAQARQLIEMLGNGNLQAVAGLPGTPNTLMMFTGAGSVVEVPRTDLVSGANYDVQVDTLAERAAYDGSDGGFSVLVANTGDGRAAIYSKLSNVVGDWSDPAYVTGPAVTLDVGSVTPVAFGNDPDVTLNPVAGGYEFDFELPENATFQSGTITTLDPGEDATFSLSPVAGGYALNLGVPRGPTGSISGVTPFWQGRITVDANAEAARAGLGAVGYSTLPAGTNLDSLDVTRAFMTSDVSPANWPSDLGAYPSGMHFQRSSTVQSQIAIGYNGQLGYRTKVSSVSWTNWRKVWDSANAPVGSQAEWEAGTGTNPRLPTPAGIAQAIAALSTGGGDPNGSLVALTLSDLKASPLVLVDGIADGLKSQTQVDAGESSGIVYDAGNEWYAAAGALGTVAVTDSDFSNTDLASYTFSAQALGAADSARKIVVGIMGIGTTSNRNPTAVTIGGMAASEIYAITFASAAGYIGFWAADVPSGTTGDVVVTWNNTMSRCGIIVWRTLGLASTATDTASATDNPAADTISVPAGGAVLGLMVNQSATSITWSGINEDADFVIEGNTTLSGASLAFESANGSLAISATPASAGSYRQMVAISVAPTILDDMNLITEAYSASEAPTTAKVAVRVKEDEAITVNTDLIASVSRDDGETWASATLELKAVDGDFKYYEGNDINLSGQPSGSALRARVQSANGKDIKVSGIVRRVGK